MDGVPVFDTVAEAVRGTGASVSLLFVPGPAIPGAAEEALDAGVTFLVLVGGPVSEADTRAILERARTAKALVVGPGSPGLIRPSAHALLGLLPEEPFSPGPLGLAARRGTRLCDLAHGLSRAGIGQSMGLAVGEARVLGLSLADAVQLFDEDPDTRVMLFVGESASLLDLAARVSSRPRAGGKPILAMLDGEPAGVDPCEGPRAAPTAGTCAADHRAIRALAEVGIVAVRSDDEVVPQIRGALEDL